MKVIKYLCPYCECVNKNIVYDEWDNEEPLCPHCNNDLVVGNKIKSRRAFWSKFIIWSLVVIIFGFFGGVFFII